jgi:hypothetical protein
MSTGLGKLQRQIIGFLQSKPSPQYENVVRWSLAEARGEIGGNDNNFFSPAIKKSFNINFGRAIKRLSEKNLLKINSKQFQTFSEIVTFFPYFTSSKNLLGLRQRLLPVIERYLEIPKKRYFGGNRHFGGKEIEEYQISEMKKNDSAKFLLLKEKWQNISQKILLFLNPGTSSKPSLWLELLVAGHKLFSINEHINTNRSFLTIFYLIRQDKQEVIEKKIVDEIYALVAEAINKEKWNVGNIKSKLYGPVVDFGKRGNSELQPSVKFFLFEKVPEILKTLPGYKEEVDEFFGSDNVKHTFGPILDQLLPRDIFRDQRFVSLS